jgi:hypothetical protein
MHYARIAMDTEKNILSLSSLSIANRAIVALAQAQSA